MGKLNFWKKFIAAPKDANPLRHRCENCLNCNASLDINQAYCPHCGAKNSSKRNTMGSLFEELLGGLFAYDGKTFYTLKYLLYKPHIISKEYCEGKQKDVNPFKLFFSVSLVFFLLYTAIGNQLQLNETIKVVNSGHYVQDIEKQRAVNNDSNLVDVAKKMENGFNKELDSTTNKQDIYISKTFLKGIKYYKYYVNTKEDDAAYALLKMKEKVNKSNISFYNKIKYYLGGDNLESDLVGKLPLFLFIALPFIALIFGLFYIRRKDLFYMDYVVFLYYIGSALLILIFLFSLIRLTFFNQLGITWSVWLLIAYTFAYFYLYYKDIWWKSILKFMLIGFTSLILGFFIYCIYFVLTTFIF